MTTTMARNDPAKAKDFSRRAWLDGVPLEPVGAPDEVAKAVSFLASDDSSDINRHRIVRRWMYGASLNELSRHLDGRHRTFSE